MGVFTSIVLGLTILRFLFLSNISTPLPLAITLDLITLLLIIPAAHYSWRFFGIVRQRLLWKIRRRLILTHIFIGAIPVLVVVVILCVSALLVFYQLSYYLILNQIGIHTAQVHGLNLSLQMAVEQGIASSSVNDVGFESILEREAKYVLANYPSAAIILQIQDRASGQDAVFATRNVRRDLLPRYHIPGWLRNRDFSGLIVEDAEPGIYRGADKAQAERSAQAAEKRGNLYLRSLVFSSFRPENPFSLEISIPFDRYVLGRLKAALGLDVLVAGPTGTSDLNVMLQSTEMLRQNVMSATFDLDQGGQAPSRFVWSMMLFPVSWNSGSETVVADTDVLFVELSTSKLFQNIFLSESQVSKTILGILKVVAGFFLMVEVISIFIGIVLTKSITNAVYNLDRGTEFVRRGDFSQRIVVRSDDQLAALARSFNQMTEYVQTLVKERVQKERLERELEIAKEVQEQLFPRAAPLMERMQLAGLCLPARVVSGDYYDFLQIDPHSLGMAIGDICGKGISAALLMANLQATLRSNVMNLQPNGSRFVESAPQNEAVERVVTMLNQQIYNHTAANKFASFFYAVYDETQGTLTYCNAGHNPPLYFRNGGYERLSVGGTVVGIFPDAHYDQATLQLQQGDLFFAYTDGIVESVNEYGEEFGEERLITLLQENRDLSAEELQKMIMDRVLEWAFEEERNDDMTLLIGKMLS
jgi:sigma-B regulation protein RsbU (phosphoserine phosphatase)